MELVKIYQMAQDELALETLKRKMMGECTFETIVITEKKPTKKKLFSLPQARHITMRKGDARRAREKAVDCLKFLEHTLKVIPTKDTDRNAMLRDAITKMGEVKRTLMAFEELNAFKHDK